MSPRRLAVLVLVLPLAACRAREGAPPLAIHLVDLHRPAEAAAKAAGPAAAAPAVPLGDWKAGPGVADLAVRDGLLTGRTTTDFPLIHLEQPPDGAARRRAPLGRGPAQGLGRRQRSGSPSAAARSSTSSRS